MPANGAGRQRIVNAKSAINGLVWTRRITEEPDPIDAFAEPLRACRTPTSPWITPARSAGLHVDSAQVGQSTFLTALPEELRRPETPLDTLLRLHIRPGPLPIE